MYFIPIIAIAAGFATRVTSLPVDSTISVSDTSSETFSGYMTWYDSEGGLGYHPGACGEINTRDQAILAMNGAQFGEHANPNLAPICGSKIRIHYKGKSVEAVVTDKCPANECHFGDIDVTQSVFMELVGELSKVPVTWSLSRSTWPTNLSVQATLAHGGPISWWNYPRWNLVCVVPRPRHHEIYSIGFIF